MSDVGLGYVVVADDKQRLSFFPAVGHFRPFFVYRLDKLQSSLRVLCISHAEFHTVVFSPVGHFFYQSQTFFDLIQRTDPFRLYVEVRGVVEIVQFQTDPGAYLTYDFPDARDLRHVLRYPKETYAERSAFLEKLGHYLYRLLSQAFVPLEQFLDLVYYDEQPGQFDLCFFVISDNILGKISAEKIFASVQLFQDIAKDSQSVVGVRSQSRQFYVRHLLCKLAAAFVKLEFDAAFKVDQVYVKFVRTVFVTRRKHYRVEQIGFT